MPMVRMLQSMASPTESWACGEEVEVSAEFAKSWVADGVAELVRSPRQRTPEDGGRSVETASRRSRA